MNGGLLSFPLQQGLLLARFCLPPVESHIFYHVILPNRRPVIRPEYRPATAVKGCERREEERSWGRRGSCPASLRQGHPGSGVTVDAAASPPSLSGFDLKASRLDRSAQRRSYGQMKSSEDGAGGLSRLHNYYAYAREHKLIRLKML